LEAHGPETPVLAMGTSNDEPFDTSLVRHALSARQRAMVTSAREESLLWNPMWPIAGAPDGSFYLNDQSNIFDQFLASKNMAVSDAAIKVDPTAVQIFKLPAMTSTCAYQNPIPFGGMGDPVNQNGFSEHFPITMTVTEVD
jgi:Endonuclease/Exonuclease/phosphatase family